MGLLETVIIYLKNSLNYFMHFEWFVNVVWALLLILAFVLSYLFSKNIFFFAINRSINKTFSAKLSEKYKSIFLNNKHLFNYLSLFMPGILAYFVLHSPWGENFVLKILFQKTISCYLIVLSVLSINSLIDTFILWYQSLAISKQKPLKGLFQVFKIVVVVVGGLYLIAMLLNTSPVVLISGIGALTAIIILIFRDTILSFTAGIQIVAYDLVRVGDWIEIQKENIDGKVVDITLNTVRIENWDKTISSLPAYELTAKSFRNWRNMEENNCRRIKRSIYIDLSTIHFCDDKVLKQYEKRFALENFLRDKKNQDMLDKNRISNLGIFRYYLLKYLQKHPHINEDMTILVRHLQPTEKGLPLEIYAFVRRSEWSFYEEVQASILEHSIGLAKEFDLKVFQEPSGVDFAAAFRLTGKEKK